LTDRTGALPFHGVQAYQAGLASGLINFDCRKPKVKIGNPPFWVEFESGVLTAGVGKKFFMSFTSNKIQAREFFKKSRDSLTPEQIQQKSQTIGKRCLQLPQVQQAKHIALYAATSSEVQTEQLFNALMKQGKNIYYPKVLSKTELGLFLVKDLKKLVPGSYGILEPPVDTALQISPTLIEVFFVPGLAFDHQGHRLGFGKGYYDRVLSQTKALKVGLTFSAQLTSKLPIATHDIKMDLVLSEG